MSALSFVPPLVLLLAGVLGFANLALLALRKYKAPRRPELWNTAQSIVGAATLVVTIAHLLLPILSTIAEPAPLSGPVGFEIVVPFMGAATGLLAGVLTCGAILGAMAFLFPPHVARSSLDVVPTRHGRQRRMHVAA